MDLYQTVFSWEAEAAGAYTALLKLWQKVGGKGISIPVRSHMVGPGTKVPLSIARDRIEEAKDLGLKVNLRFWADVKGAGWVAPPARAEDLGLNPYCYEAMLVIGRLIREVQAYGLFGLADTIVAGWNGDMEVDVKRYGDSWLTCPQSTEQAYIDRTRDLISFIARQIQPTVPFGAQRGSLWHQQRKRLNLPPAPCETLGITADAGFGTVENVQTAIAMMNQYFGSRYKIMEFDVAGLQQGAGSDADFRDRMKLVADAGFNGQLCHFSPDKVKEKEKLITEIAEFFNG